MKLTTLTIILLVIISSCTVEKRLYNRGWNVQWRKHHQVSNSETEVASNAEVEFISEQKSSSKEEYASYSSEEEAEQISTDILVVADDLTEISPKFYQEPEDTTKKSVKTPSPYADMSTSRDRRGTGSTNIPITFIILGALAIIGAVLLYFALATISDAIAFILYVLLMFGLGLLGFILLFAGLLLLWEAQSRHR